LPPYKQNSLRLYVYERTLKHNFPLFIGARHIQVYPNWSAFEFTERWLLDWRKKCPLRFLRFPWFELLGILSKWPQCMGLLTWRAAHRHMFHVGYVAVCCSVLQCVAVCCSVLQCVAVCCSVLQCVAVRCIRECDVLGPAVVTSGNTRQDTATHCHVFCVDFIHMLAIYARYMMQDMWVPACVIYMHVMWDTSHSYVKHDFLIGK